MRRGKEVFFPLSIINLDLSSFKAREREGGRGKSDITRHNQTLNKDPSPIDAGFTGQVAITTEPAVNAHMDTSITSPGLTSLSSFPASAAQSTDRTSPQAKSTR